MKKGFTMIELIIVIIVIGILAGLALPQYTKMIERGQMTRAKSALDMIRKAEGIYFTNNSAYVDVAQDGWTEGTDLVSEVAELTSLKTDPDWKYEVATENNGRTFLATATRQKGVYKDSCKVTMTDAGAIVDYDAAIRAGDPTACP